VHTLTLLVLHVTAVGGLMSRCLWAEGGNRTTLDLLLAQVVAFHDDL
jgi:hypothetical protein